MAFLQVVTLFYFMLLRTIIHGMIAYDCGSSNLNVTTLSLLDIGKCDIQETTPNISDKYIQLLQLSHYTNTKIIQCKIEIDRIIHHCGMHSHISDVLNGRMQYILDVTSEQCKRMHETGLLKIGYNTDITGLQVNHTNFHAVLLAGNVDTDGSCSGSQYSDPYGTWNQVIVQATVKITLQEYFARVHLNTDKIFLRSGVSCTLSRSSCVDIEGGYTFWRPVPTDNCHFDEYDVLYEGISNKFIDIESNSPAVFSVTTNDITFALTTTGRQHICGHIIFTTEHPKLFIFETEKGFSLIKRKISTDNLDLFTYVNSKFIYLEKHIRTQMKMLYYDVLRHKCFIEQEFINHALSIAMFAPDEFAYSYMKGPGYMASINGEVVHVIKCIPVEVEIRETKSCYLQLPVSRGNQSFYVTPRSHILMKTGTEVICNPALPTLFLVNNQWYEFSPKPREVNAPAILKPTTKPTWRYINPTSLGTSGVYTEKDLEKLRDHIMFPIERSIVLNTVARGMSGQPVGNQGYSISHLLDEDSLNKIADSAWSKIWSSLLTFGHASAAVIGLILILRGIKLAADTVIHGYALHKVYGWSIHLLGAIWASVTNVLLHLARQPNETQESRYRKDYKKTKTSSNSSPFTSYANSSAPSDSLVKDNQDNDACTDVHPKLYPQLSRFVEPKEPTKVNFLS